MKQSIKKDNSEIKEVSCFEVEDLAGMSVSKLYSGEPCGKPFNFAPAFASLDRVVEPQKKFVREVVKAYDRHSSPREEISFHGPETHGNHLLHTQLTFINRDKRCHGALRFTIDSDD